MTPRANHFFGSNQIAKNMKNKLILMKRGSQQSFPYLTARDDSQKIEIVIKGTGRATNFGTYGEHEPKILVKQVDSFGDKNECPIGVSSMNLHK